ncbi:hypothetical protein SERLA73DRAFT_159774 [Serpula lacrymans var. lacrymans S7.3]|uniref:Glucose-methanol-choline oxidoreductase N-terminal domain-containing protein n=1 Tax=Serpula lacrymans var. lacrymans (strain S7.3) TaxID=936435 RepID=F8PSR9_SERL3|nr:hypothetical protein SERLA73DRAFT_159774 [Serpula lacrymans var. lacrymans S7.3]
MLVTAQDAIAKTYDFVIIGGGTAGLCLAARLTEDPNVTVLLLEAGVENLDDPMITLSAQYGSHFGQKAYDWGFQTTPQKSCDGAQFFWPRGKLLGGSSAINFLVWSKPPASHIDDWEKLGNPGWNWASYDKCMQKVENFLLPSPEVESMLGLDSKQWFANASAPLKTGYPATTTSVEIAAYKTLLNMGIQRAADPMNGDPNGVFFTPNSIDTVTHTRTYATTAYYLPNIHRPNFSVLVAAHVTQILTSQDAPGSKVTATGVEFIHGDQKYTINANKEVVLCAGAISSPHILELSGIGRKSVLDSIQVPLKVDLPGVGENVQEHMFAGVTYELASSFQEFTLDFIRDPEVAKQHAVLHAAGQGVYTMGVTGMAYTPLKAITEHCQTIYEAAKAKVIENISSYPPGLYEQYEMQLERLINGTPICELIIFPGFLSFPNPPTPGKNYITICPALNNNFSRGTIHSVSSSPFDKPALDPHYFEQDVDLQVMVEILKFIRKMPEHAPFKDVLASPLTEVNPGPSVVTDDDIRDHLKKCLSTTFHTAGSLSMLPKDKGGVVDHNLKVYDTTNIRVVDLSIVPVLFTAHPQGKPTVYMIAEKGAEIIQGQT